MFESYIRYAGNYYFYWDPLSQTRKVNLDAVVKHSRATHLVIRRYFHSMQLRRFLHFIWFIYVLSTFVGGRLTIEL